MTRRLAILRPIALIASATALVGCASNNATNATQPAAEHTRATAPAPDLFQPMRVRLHPLTHYIPSASPGAPASIDAHVELLDRWGLPVRALGALRFIARTDKKQTALIAQSRPSFTGAIVWNIDMSNPEQNAFRYYDPITRTYHITLSDPALSLLDSPFTLDIVFRAPGAAPRSASRKIIPH